MYRKFYGVLEEWEDKKTKEPLLVTGARQVGKTWIIKKFCSERYNDHLYLNFESEPGLSDIFEESLEPYEILKKIGIYKGRKIDVSTALFFDEIQKCEKAITSLKYFCEAEENYRIIGAGSLLGVKINRFSGSFPVGKIRQVRMYPMDFEEFLMATGEELLAEEIESAYKAMKPMPGIIHEKAIHLYRDYLYVGGMPQCVDNYISSNCDVTSFDRELQHFILLAYSSDMSKYTTSAAEGVKIAAVYESVPRQLAKENPKFKYKEVRSNANKRDFYEPIDWLRSSGMVYKVDNTETIRTPLKLYADDKSFKLYMSDAGLLSYAGKIKYSDLLNTSDNLFKGALAENYVVQSLAAKGHELLYHKPDAGLEIDLLLDMPEGIIPVEIKAGRHKRSVSLKKYREKYKPEKAIRISENNFGETEGICSVPLYAAFCL